MQTLDLKKDFIKKDFKCFLKDIGARKNKYTINSYINYFIENLVGWHGIYNNKYLKTNNFDDIQKELIKILEE